LNWSKITYGLFGVVILSYSGAVNANCWGQFDRVGAEQFGYVLAFSVPGLGESRSQFKGVVGADDQITHNIVFLEFSDDDSQRLKNTPPVIVAIIGDVEITNGGLKLIKVRRILRSLDEVREAKEKSNLTYTGTCESSFAKHWSEG
jgi:hypothetical protein